ncbi:hypothetical protein LTR70_001886 [Exophiala xenobiotica]|uniref:Uncharacterized protein n=1 Tax=Lithohypha guttulata TaxID=1690604 RepID=A0ABR0K9W9_9EURO|nr:hypothetical protein LTR24_005112 [Lithohypha guttulata]KAK5326871.1 hypothetical protein LTR70_001886 [Exophiala xenobiotica]
MNLTEDTTQEQAKFPFTNTSIVSSLIEAPLQVLHHAPFPADPPNILPVSNSHLRNVQESLNNVVPKANWLISAMVPSGEALKTLLGYTVEEYFEVHTKSGPRNTARKGNSASGETYLARLLLTEGPAVESPAATLA